MILLINIAYGTFTTKGIRFHKRSVEVKQRSNSKNVLRDPILGMNSHMISLTHICYGMLTPNFIRGHHRSLEVKNRSH